MRVLWRVGMLADHVYGVQRILAKGVIQLSLCKGLKRCQRYPTNAG